MDYITAIGGIQDKVVWRRDATHELDIKYLCISCREVIYTVNVVESIPAYKEKLIDIVNNHVLNCLGHQEAAEVELPPIRMIRV